MNDIRLGIIFSAVFHVTLITVSVVGVPALMREPPNIPEAIPVEIVDIDDLTRIKQEARDEPEPQPEPKPAPRPPEPQPRVAEAAPEPDAVPMPDAKPQKKVEKKPEIRPKDRISMANAPRVKPRPPSRLDAGRLAALIDRSVQEKEEERLRLQREEEEKQKKLDEAIKQAQVSRLDALRSTATLAALIQRRMQQCWTMPAGAKDAAEHIVRIRMYLNPDGTLARPPVLIDQPGLDTASDSFYKIAAESALRAVRRCEPYPLPKDRYEQWRQIDLNFDPREMVGG